eukprot:7381660-Pyramimonas_sp.AAC.1
MSARHPRPSTVAMIPPMPNTEMTTLPVILRNTLRHAPCSYHERAAPQAQHGGHDPPDAEDRDHGEHEVSGGE